MKRFVSLLLGWIGCVLLTGCTDEGITGPARYADKIVGGCDPVVWQYEDGEPTYCYAEGWLAYQDIMGDIINRKGVRMDRVFENAVERVPEVNMSGWYYVPTGQTGIEGGTVTGDGGRLMLKAYRQWHPRNKNWFGAGVQYRPPNATSDDIVGYFSFGTQGTLPPETYPKYAQWAAEPEITGGAPAYTRPDHASGNTNLLAAEIQALADPAPSTNGLDYTITLVQQCGSMGTQYVEDLSEGFMPFNLINPDNIFRYAGPCMCSVTVRTGGPIDLSDYDFQMQVWTESDTEGILVDAKAFTSNPEQTAWVIRSDYILPSDPQTTATLEGQDLTVYDCFTPLDDPNDPNNYLIEQHWDDVNDVWVIDRQVSILDTSDPNFIIDGIYDPNRVRPVTIIEIDEGDSVHCKLIMTDELLMQLFRDICQRDSWLREDPVFDLNQDGIVNKKDLYYLTQP